MTELVSVLFGRDEVSRRVRELGRAITQDHADRAPVLITVLKGGAIFLADLMRQIELPVELHFMAISRYGGAEESLGRVQILLDVDADITGRPVILVEDIVDTGLTLTYLLSALKERGPASLEVCALLDKSVRRIVPVDIRYAGFDCPDRFVVGYGMDLHERYRNVPDILQVNDSAALDRAPDELTSLITAGP
jgi:hypoxanthine phosphoribosyltransferase